MNYSPDNFYYLVKGWYDKNQGLHQGSFYGAVAEPANYLEPKRCVLHGEDAKKAANDAAQQNARVFPEEILGESCGREDPPDRHLDKKTELTPKEKERTKHMLLDKDKTEEDELPEWIADLKEEILSELSTGTGAIAMGPLDTILANPSLNKSRLGMSDRGGHGSEKNLGPKKVKPGKNFAKGHSSTLKGFGTSHRSSTTGSSSGGTGSSGALPTISQGSTGRRGGRG